MMTKQPRVESPKFSDHSSKKARARKSNAGAASHSNLLSSSGFGDTGGMSVYALNQAKKEDQRRQRELEEGMKLKLSMLSKYTSTFQDPDQVQTPIDMILHPKYQRRKF